MKNFKCLDVGTDPRPFLEAIAAIEGIRCEQTGRHQSATVQREALALPVRGLRRSWQGQRARRDVHESQWTSGSTRLPPVCSFLQRIEESEDAIMGRAKVVSLPPGNKVYPPVDPGEYYRIRNRCHFILQSSGSWMCVGDEEVWMKTGELRWFDNNIEHEAMNDGDSARIHLIFDLLPQAIEKEVSGLTEVWSSGKQEQHCRVA